MTVVIAAALALAIALPHGLSLDNAPPGTAAFLWLCVLTLRALTALLSAAFVVLYLPTTGLFTLVSGWCWHAVLPFVATHLGLQGHDFGDVALLAPTVFLVFSTLWVIVGLYRATRRVQRLLRSVIGGGPQESLVLGAGDVLVAAAGVRRPKVLVSAGALTVFDDEELAASLDHERGHIAHRHRYVLIYAELCRALGRFVPGTRSATRELRFHLERDADRYAVARRHDPTALASAICKAASSQLLSPPAFSLAGSSVSRRVRGLLDDAPDAPGHFLRILSATLAALVVFTALSLPAAAHAGWDQATSLSPSHHCPD